MIIVAWLANRRARYSITALFFAIATFDGAKAGANTTVTPDPIDNGGQAVAADTTANLPTIEETQERLTGLAASTEVPEEIKPQLTELLTKFLEAQKKLAEVRSRQEKLTEQIASVPNLLRTTKDLLEQSPPSLETVDDRIPLEKVRAEKTEKDAELATAKARRAELQARVENRMTRRTQATDMIASLRTELQKLETETPPPTDPENKKDPKLLVAERWDRTARVELVRARLAVQQQEQRAIEAEEELLPLQVQLAERQVTQLEKEVAMLTQAVSSRREIKVEAALKAHRDALLADGLDPAGSIALRLGDAWTELVKKHGIAEKEKAAAGMRAEKLAQEYTSTAESIQNDIKINGSLRSGLGLKLQRQRSKLPDLSDLYAQVHTVDVRIDEMGSLQAQLEMMIDDLDGRGLTNTRYSMSADDPAIIREVAILQQINRDIDNYTSDLIETKNHLEQLMTTVDEFRHEIDANVLWIRNTRPYSLNESSVAWHSFKWVLSPGNLKQLWTASIGEIIHRPDVVILWLALSGILFGFGSKLRKHIRELGELAAKRNQTGMRPTLRALWMTGLLSLPLVVLFGIPGWRLSELAEETEYVRAVGNAILLMAAVVFPFELARQLVRPNGLAVMHLGFKSETATVIRSALRFSIDLGLPIALVWGIAHNSGHASINAALARPLFLCGMVIMTLALWKILHPQTGIMEKIVSAHPGGWLDRLRYVWHPGLSGIPLVLGVMSMAGYSYSARQLAEQLYWTVWLVLGLIVVGGTMRRWVTVSKRRLLLAQARQRASEAERRDAVPVDLVIENNGPDLTEINAQTLRLINAMVTMMTVLGLYYMWAPVLPAIRFFDTWTLWDGKDTNGDIVPITLANLLTTLPIIALTFVCVRNVPGLMENVLLQKLPLENAVRYAITTLSSYVMLLVGVMVSANTLGLRWESIQWLVAALGVGLGFGLQEIFANFISGIILLFEQPIRVGDVVTIDGTTGAVSRIRMRATTVTNWDRQELIIPNKDLITGRLINWTLSDSTNRVVINVGVAYGSETRRACRLLETICDEHPNVAEDPVPIITFEGFGDSTLNLVVRCYLKTLDVRLKTIHELHTEINERFTAEGIEIAFPQRDLHIRSLPQGFQAIMQTTGEQQTSLQTPEASRKAA